jgi:competence protein ComGC
MLKTRQSGFTALSLILSLLVIAFTAFLIVGYLSGQRDGTTGAVDSPIKRARSVECLGQIRKIEMQVQLYSVQNGRYPEGLSGLRTLSEADVRCPVTQNYYQYDVLSGRVSCPDHVR